MNKTATKILAFVGALAILGGATIGGMQLWAPDEVKPSNWGHSAQAGDNGGYTVANDGVELYVATIPTSQYSELGISATALSAYQITATVKDEGGRALEEIQGVGFSMAWASEYSDEVTDYVTMTADSKTATFVCNKAFTVTINVTATSLIDGSKSATATLDYYKRLTGVNVEFCGTTETIGLSGGVVNVHFPEAYNLQYVRTTGYWINPEALQWAKSFVYSDGSADNPIGSDYAVSISIAPSEEFRSVFDGMHRDPMTTKTISFPWASYKTSSNETCRTLNYFYARLVFGDNDLGAYVANLASGTYDVLTRALYRTSNQFTVTIEATPTYGGKVTFSYVVNAYVDAPTVGDVELDKPSVML